MDIHHIRIQRTGITRNVSVQQAKELHANAKRRIETTLTLSFIRHCCLACFYLVGCWPSIAAAIIGGNVTGGARVLSHTISFWLTLSVLSCMLLYTAWCTRLRSQIRPSHVGVYGPLYLMTLAALLVMADPTRHFLQDREIWSGESSNAFHEGCGEGWGCLTMTGVIFCILCTYLGFLMMFTASMWNGNLLAKCSMCAKEWKKVRMQHAEQALADAKVAREEKAAAAAVVAVVYEVVHHLLP